MKKILDRARVLLWSTGILFLSSPAFLRAQDTSFPYSANRQESLAPALTGGSLALLGWWLEDARAPIRPEQLDHLAPDQINPFDRIAIRQWSPEWRHGSDLGLAALVGGAILALGIEGVRALNDSRGEDALTLALMTSETYLLTAGITTTTKALVGRIRPYAYNPALSEEERQRIVSEEGNDVFFSFFSGHASFAFAAATLSSRVMTDIHGSSSWSNLMWGSTLGLAGLTAYARVKAGMHFPSDVLVGGLVGMAVGSIVPRIHDLEEEEDLVHVLGTPLQLGFRVPFG